jgi:hypothetical protein
MQGSDTQQFDPSQFIYPNADAEGDIAILSYARHLTLFNRASSLSLNLAGGSVDVDVNTTRAPTQFLPSAVTAGSSFSQSASGFADPTVQLDVNLFGTSQLKSTVDLANYEPTLTVDAAVMVAAPLGQYDDDKLVNLGLNRWYGRFALPMKYHFGAFEPGYRTSFELTPSVWLFADNDDFVGKELENDPMWQLEAHLTRDFTRSFSGSIDMLYRTGFQSKINGKEVGEELEVGNLGFTLNYQVSDNVAIRTGFSSNVFGDSGLDNSIIRVQFVYGWHNLMENMKKLRGH